MKLVYKFYKHKRRMKVSNLHDDEYYQVTLRLRDGAQGFGIVPGHLLKEKDFWKRKVACHPMVNLNHFSRSHNPIPKPKKRRQWTFVEVGFPWRNSKGRIMTTMVSPWSNSRSSWRAQRDPEYAELVRKYIVQSI